MRMLVKLKSVLTKGVTMKAIDNDTITKIMTRLAAELIEATQQAEEPTTNDMRVRLREAAGLHLLVQFDYKKSNDTDFHERVVRVESYGLAVDGYITGWDYDRQEYRSFRLSRIHPSSLRVAV